MEHAAVDQRRRVLEADERGELAGLVELPGDLLDLLPGALGRLLAVDALLVADVEPRRRPLRQTSESLLKDLHVSAADAFAERATNSAADSGLSTQMAMTSRPFGVIGHRGEVERRAQLLAGAAEERHRLAARELVGVARREPVAEDVAVDRERSVNVEVAEVGVALGIARHVGLLGRRRPRLTVRLVLGLLLVRAAREARAQRPS